MFFKLFKNRKTLIIYTIMLEFVLIIFNGMRFGRESMLEIFQDNLFVGDSTGNYTAGFYTDHSYMEGSYVATDLLFLKKGIYSIKVDYNSNSDGDWHKCYTTMYPEYDTSKEKTANLVYCDKVGLPADGNSVSYLSWVRYGTDYRVILGPQIDASGDGIYVLANKITITYLKNRTILFETSKLLLLFLVIDIAMLIFLFRKNEARKFLSNGNEIILAGLLFIIGFSSYPLISRDLYFGDDIFYHLRRVAHLAEGLKSGIFPVKIQPGWDNGYGYAVGIGYGSLLLYPSAILVILGSTIQFAYKFYIFLTNVLTTCISYYTFKRISSNKYIGLICSTLFTLMGFRIHSIYSGATVGEFGAYTFLPLVILGLYEIYQNKTKYAYITLALGITFTLSSHVLSTLILAIVVPLFCIILFEKTIKREVIVPLVKAFFLTVVLNLYFIVPCAEYLLFQDMRGNINKDILWAKGKEFVNLLVNMDDISFNTGGWSGIGFYSLIILALAIGVVFTGKFKEKTSSYIRILLLMFSLIFLSTNSIAYFWLKYNVKPIYDLLGNLEFTWHFLDISCGLIVFFAAKVFEVIFKNTEKKYIGLAISAIMVTLCICQSGAFIRETIVEGNPITMYDDAKLSGLGSDEFAIKGVDKSLTSCANMIVSDDTATADITKRKGTTIYANIKNPSGKAVLVEAPLWGYCHYSAKSGSEKLNVSMSANKKVAVEIPAGFNGQVKIYFHEPWYWRLAELVSLLALVWAVREKFCSTRFFGLFNIIKWKKKEEIEEHCE